jgi:hypothetical protein
MFFSLLGFLNYGAKIQCQCSTILGKLEFDGYQLEFDGFGQEFDFRKFTVPLQKKHFKKRMIFYICVCS